MSKHSKQVLQALETLMELYAWERVLRKIVSLLKPQEISLLKQANMLLAKNPGDLDTYTKAEQLYVTDRGGDAFAIFARQHTLSLKLVDQITVMNTAEKLDYVSTAERMSYYTVQDRHFTACDN